MLLGTGNFLLFNIRPSKPPVCNPHTVPLACIYPLRVSRVYSQVLTAHGIHGSLHTCPILAGHRMLSPSLFCSLSEWSPVFHTAAQNTCMLLERMPFHVLNKHLGSCGLSVVSLDKLWKMVVPAAHSYSDHAPQSAV